MHSSSDRRGFDTTGDVFTQTFRRNAWPERGVDAVLLAETGSKVDAASPVQVVARAFGEREKDMDYTKHTLAWIAHVIRKAWRFERACPGVSRGF